MLIQSQTSAEAKYTLMKRGSLHICAATDTGSVHFIDPGSCKVVRTWQAHAGWINDMDVRSDLLVTCGYSQRQQQGFALDHLVNVFNLKILHPLPPVPFPPGAAFVRMHPRMSTTCLVASSAGLIYAIDIMNPDAPSMRHANIFDTHLLAMDLAPSGEALALADGQCAIHLWGSPTKIQFTEYASPTEFPDTMAPVPTLDFSPEVPLNVVGMPYYRDSLLSSWPSHIVSEVGAPPAKIDSGVLSTLKRSEIGGFAPFPRKTRRYQFEDTRAVQRAADTLAAPRFISERTKDDRTEYEGHRRMSEALEALGDLALDGSTRKEVPVMYRNVEIKYSKFGVDDFDFEYVKSEGQRILLLTEPDTTTRPSFLVLRLILRTPMLTHYFNYSASHQSFAISLCITPLRHAITTIAYYARWAF